MVILQGFAVAVLVSVILPLILDRFVGDRKDFSTARRVGAYALMILIALIIPMLLSGNTLINSVGAVFAVAVALYIDRVSIWGTIVVLLVITIVFPAYILILIADHNHIKAPLSWFLQTTEWHTFLAPFVCGIFSFVLFYRLWHRFKIRQ